MYDFSLNEGDSIWHTNYTGGHFWFYVDSIRYINTYAGPRKAWYLHFDQGWVERPVWVEGIGSLAGFWRYNMEPSLYWWGWGILNCWYANDELIYKSNVAEKYGCEMEIDPDPPILEVIDITPDTVSLDDPIQILVVAYDMTNLTITATLSSPDGTEYSYTGFTFEEDYGVYYTQVNDFHNQTGNWYLSKLVLEDEQNNITEENYSSESSPGKFYVKEPDDINEIINKSQITVFPNPVSNISILEFENKEHKEFSIEIYNVYSKKIYSGNTNSELFQIHASGLNNGMYFYVISSGNKIIYTNKFIVKH